MRALRRPSAILPSLLLVAAAGVLAGCHAPPPPAEEITIWQRRGAWMGRGLTQTEPFIGDTGFLRLTWEAHGAPNAGAFKITVHSDVSGRPLLVAVDRRGPGRDVTYVTEDPRAFFLVIESEDLDWSVEVAEGLSGTRTLPRP
ncbi:MAG: hypothetical protein A3J29_02350 [Acidobacteria bacterium RIFCSPLOWO2_12_FULL_67_14b]|nr:MAG: hypothetical protein A3J29_02350 [Acidobacteria bacterium RIFCSPLOWO2_12_FULL_67_14b]